MASLAEIRQQYPQYGDMPDAALADALHKKFYSDMPRAEFDAKIGLTPEPAPSGGGMMGGGAMSAANYDIWPVKIAKSLFSGATLPGDVYAGKVDPNSQEAIERSTELASIPALGATAAPRGALGSGAVRGALPSPQPSGPPPVVPIGRNELIEAGKRQGIEIPKGVASDRMVTQRVGQVVSAVPLGGGPLRRASEKAIAKTGEAADRIASGYGGGSVATPATAGDTARVALERYIGPTTKARIAKAYDAVDALVNPQITTPLNKTAEVATKIVGERQAAALSGPGKAVGLITEGASRPEGLTYEGVKKLRTSIGEMLDTGLLPPDISQAELKRIYAALSEDLKSSVTKAGGPKALAAFERANKYNQLVNERRENLMRIVGAKNDEGVFDRLTKAAGGTSTADVNLLLQARKAIPAEEWDEVASAVVARMGRSGDAGGAVGSGPGPGFGDFSPARFVTAYQKLSKPGRDVLFRSTGQKGLADALDDVAVVSSRFKELNRFANPSGTAGQIMGGAQLASGAAGGTAMLLGALDPFTFASTLLPPWVMAKALARPATARAAAGYGRAYNAHLAKPSRLTEQALGFASRRFATEIGQEFQIGANAVNQFAAGLEGGSTSAAAESNDWMKNVQPGHQVY